MPHDDPSDCKIWRQTVFKVQNDKLPTSRNLKTTDPHCRVISCNLPLPLPGQGLKTCAKCKSTHYCSVEHQKDHWPEHKAWCKKTQEAQKILESTPNPNPDMPSFPDLKRMIEDFDNLHAFSIFRITASSMELGGRSRDPTTHFMLINVAWRPNSESDGGNPAKAFRVLSSSYVPDSTMDISTARERSKSFHAALKDKYGYRGTMICMYVIRDAFYWGQTYIMWRPMFPPASLGIPQQAMIDSAKDMINNGAVLRMDNEGNWGQPGLMVKKDSGTWVWKKKTDEEVGVRKLFG